MELTTSVTAGSLEAFQAAFSRSVLGVTVKKYKKKGGIFWKNKEHNQEITKKSFEYIYLLLREEYKNGLNDIDIKINYTIGWDNDQGKILYFKDIISNCYLKMCELNINELKLKEEEGIVNLKLFYSDYDRASIELISYLDAVLSKFDELQINIERFKLGKKKYSENADLYKVEYIPTVIIDHQKVEPLTKTSLENKLNAHLNRQIYPPKTELKKIHELEPVLVSTD